MYLAKKDETHEAWAKPTIARLLYFMKHTCQSNVLFSSLHNLQYVNILDDSNFELKLRGDNLKDIADDDIIYKILPAMKQVELFQFETLH